MIKNLKSRNDLIVSAFSKSLKHHQQKIVFSLSINILCNYLSLITERTSRISSRSCISSGFFSSTGSASTSSFFLLIAIVLVLLFVCAYSGVVLAAVVVGIVKDAACAVVQNVYCLFRFLFFRFLEL